MNQNATKLKRSLGSNNTIHIQKAINEYSTSFANLVLRKREYDDIHDAVSQFRHSIS